MVVNQSGYLFHGEKLFRDVWRCCEIVDFRGSPDICLIQHLWCPPDLGRAGSHLQAARQDPKYAALSPGYSDSGPSTGSGHNLKTRTTNGWLPIQNNWENSCLIKGQAMPQYLYQIEQIQKRLDIVEYQQTKPPSDQPAPKTSSP